MQPRVRVSGGKLVGVAFVAVALVVVCGAVLFAVGDENGGKIESMVESPTPEPTDATPVVVASEGVQPEGPGTVEAADIPANTSDELALLEHATAPWTGDLDAMLERGFIRVLTAFNPLFFHYDGAEQKGIVHDGMQQFAQELHKSQPKGQPPVRILIIPVVRDDLLPALVQGRGDIVTANLTITPERQKVVQFTDPNYPDVNELVVTGPAAPDVTSLDDLTSTPIHVRESSSYFEHLVALNKERKESGLGEIAITKVNEKLEDYDLLEMVGAGLIPAVVVDSHKAAFWVQVFDGIKVHEDLATHRGGNIAWAIRKDSPKLLEAANTFLRKARKGTTLGNILLKRYIGDADWIDNALAEDGWHRHGEVIDLIKKYAGEYEFDWLIITAQGYQESKLDQSKVSAAGAIGIMQVMPTTAADPNVGIADIEHPERNVQAGVKYLHFLRDRYFSEPEIDPLNRVLFSFAAYNAGPANIAKARKKATEMNLDPDQWFGHVEVATARVVSREPVVYVRNIFKYYVAYKLYEDARTAKTEVREKN